ncbi:hypothetical protein [Methylophaga sp. OBS4]|uniref:hypothetical protein n=1 Tax=Methylophaga sp. OBS4 TaxID=2991935 RepID=UPI002255B404|nr:hypothetical protein [Methylophaga sp. OBS4]MCX4187711.1 hypothetical protein [Methylophaga sp. OBS4]
MSILVIQIVIKQWDKGQRSEEHIKARQQIPDRYPVTSPAAQYFSEHQIVLDQHGDDVMGNRIRYELTDDNQFIIDRFCFDLNKKTVEYIAQPDSMLPPKLITTLENNWIQCKYKWRYKVFEGGLFYWLYEEMIVNAHFVDSLTEDVFMTSDPALVFQGGGE